LVAQPETMRSTMEPDLVLPGTCNPTMPGRGFGAGRARPSPLQNVPLPPP